MVRWIHNGLCERFALATVLAVTLLLVGGASGVAGESESGSSGEGSVLAHLFDFEGDDLPDAVELVHARARHTERDATSGKKALVVEMQSAEHSAAMIALVPETPWDWSEHADFSLAMDIGNHGEVSTQLYLDVVDHRGYVTTRSVSIPVGGPRTYYSKLHGHDLGSPEADTATDLNFNSGLRSNPPTWPGEDVQFIALWGAKHLDIKGISRINLVVKGALRDKQITLDNVRIIANPPLDEAFLEGIVDRFGQNAKDDFPGKVHSIEELLAERDAELKMLENQGPFADRSRFGGWKNGPKLEGTGYFRTQKIDGVWSLVDPEGYLYFATGLDIIRLSNSTTMTGFDFDPNAVPKRSADDMTPEDSMGLNRVPPGALPTRHLVSAVRAKMFRWLPDYDDPLGDHYGYRRSAHSGPLEHGETYSFYSANLERRYGEDAPLSYLDDWERVTVDRMLAWGFTSLGNWTDPRFYDQERIPFFANGWIIGDFKTVSSGDDFWAPLPDVFDPVFEQRAMATAEQIAREVNGSPWCVGVFVDNEKSFGRPYSDESRLGIVLHTLRRDGKDVPTKRAFTRLMRDKYGSIKKLNTAWGTQIRNWRAFTTGIDLPLRTEAQIADYSSLLEAYAGRYFTVVENALRTHMPNHLYLGARFPDWGMPIEVVRASARHVDVISFNSYKEGLPPHEWRFLEEIDMPSIIGEFHIGASDSGLFHPGLIHAADQQDRARMYREYVESVIDNPYFVGAHWFQYIDSPISGRAHDGENYNVGFVRVTDTPYAPMVEGAKALHRTLYPRRFEGLKEQQGDDKP